jgi:hypothetical protein
MPLAELIQSLIHKLDTGAMPRVLRAAALVLAVIGLMLLYDLRDWRNMTTPEGMDAAQLARNIAEGKGYTTLFIRPFSLFLVQKHDQARGRAFGTNAVPDFARINTAHPDLANPPVYPVVLAGLMKVLPFNYSLQLGKPFWSDNGRFLRYQPDFIISLFNQLLLVAVVVLTFVIARKIFDPAVAWLAATLTLGCDLLWRFSTSGQSTLLLLVIFMGLVWCVLKIEELAREPKPRARQLLGWVVAAGVLAGVGALTRYAFGWVIIPLALFLILFTGQRRVLHAVVAVGAFAVVLTPWIVRNQIISGTPFGTAGFAVVEGTLAFPRFQLERSVHPDLTHAFWMAPYLLKLGTNLQKILQDGLPRLGGSWAGMLFLAGLLLGFRNVAIRRMRYFIVMCLGVFVVVQALGQTQLTQETPELNSENLLVLLAPMVFIFGVSFFVTMLNQMNLPALALRYPIIAVFAALSCLPMIFALLSSRVNPVVYPPYYPPDIQKTAGWMKSSELMMSDTPWAMAWYGRHQCVWLTLNSDDDFFAINDYLKPVQALYLTPEIMDGKFLSDWIRGGDRSWGKFVVQAISQSQIPNGFPLRHVPVGSAAIESGIFLTDQERWKFPAPE